MGRKTKKKKKKKTGKGKDTTVHLSRDANRPHWVRSTTLGPDDGYDESNTENNRSHVIHIETDGGYDAVTVDLSKEGFDSEHDYFRY